MRGTGSFRHSATVIAALAGALVLPAGASASVETFERFEAVATANFTVTEQCADGSTVQVFYDLQRGRPMRTPADLVADFEAFEGRTFPSRPPD